MVKCILYWDMIVIISATKRSLGSNVINLNTTATGGCYHVGRSVAVYCPAAWSGCCILLCSIEWILHIDLQHVVGAAYCSAAWSGYCILRRSMRCVLHIVPQHGVGGAYSFATWSGFCILRRRI